MKKTYTRTMGMTNEELQQATVTIEWTEGTKWGAHWRGEEIKEIRYTGLTQWSLVDGEDAAKIEAEIGDDTMLDECHEYLVLEFNDGTTATFRNSHVNMFIR